MEQLDTEPWYQQFWPWALISLPATAVIGCMITITLAIRSNDGLVRDDYYKDGLAINQTFARDERAKALGLSADVVINPDRKLVEMRLDQDIDDPTLTLHFIHATRAGLDQRIDLERLDARTYRGQLDHLLAKGKWHIEVVSSRKDWRLAATLNHNRYQATLEPRL